jgi:hypothetical protein
MVRVLRSIGIIPVRKDCGEVVLVKVRFGEARLRSSGGRRQKRQQQKRHTKPSKK